MRRKQRADRHDPMEEAIRKAGSIGELERLAGIGRSDTERHAFWKDYSALPGSQGLDAGVAELKRRIRAQAGREAPT